MRAGALGDVLLLRRAVAVLRRAGFAVTLMAPRHSGSVLVGPGGSQVDALIDWEGAGCAALLQPGVPLPHSLRDALGGSRLALVCSRTAALVQLRALIPDVRGVDPRPPAGAHAARWYCSPLADIGDCAVEPAPLQPTAGEEAAAAEWLARLPAGFLAVHPGSGSPAKNWPADRFAALARSLSPDRRWLLVAGAADAAPAAALAREPGAVVARELPARVLGALLVHAGLYVGNDSGVTHLAAAYGTATLALFGPTDPAQWSPVGPRVAVLRARDGDMTQLPLSEVTDAAQRV